MKIIFFIACLFHLAFGQIAITILNETLISGTNAGSFFGQSVATLGFDAVAVGIPTANQVQLIFFDPDGTRSSTINPPVLTPAATTTNWGLSMDASDLNSMNGPTLVISEQGITTPLTFFDLIPLSSIRAGMTPIFTTRSRDLVIPETATIEAPQKRGIAIGEVIPIQDVGDRFTLFLVDILPFSNRFVTGLMITTNTFDDVNEEIQTTSVDNSAVGGDAAAFFTYNGSPTVAVGAPSLNSGNGLVLMTSVSQENFIGPEVILQNGFPGLSLPSGAIGFGLGLAAADLNPQSPASGDDLIVTARGLNDEGLLFVLLFSTTGNLIQTIPLIPGTNFNIGDLLGAAVSVADFDNDQVADLIVGAPGRNSNTGALLTLQLAFCGDSVMSGNEGCDDGNISNGDGCDSSCGIELGWECTISPSVCTEICGDGMRVASEISPTVCDDGNLINGDGCDESCQPESGFSCTQLDNQQPSQCTAGCGDGSILGGEICDDGNLSDGDGCSENCLLEEGFICVSTPSVCTAVCGDGQTVGNEECDDGNLESGDGCDENCFMEAQIPFQNQGSSSFPAEGIVGIVLGVCVLICIIACLVILFLAYYVKVNRSSASPAQLIELSPSIPLLTNVTFGEVLGSGNFGVVYKGSWQGTDIALKSIKGVNPKDFENELSVLVELRHPKCISFFGICVRDNEQFLALEFMNVGDLLHELQTNPELSLANLLSFCEQCAKGMSFLHAKNILHRDLACRNLLLSSSNQKDFVLKVTDFGLSRQTEDYYTVQSKNVPIRWTAPEVFEFGKASKPSDVWSYGIVMWEIFSRGGIPYAGLTHMQVIEYVKGGNRLSHPLTTPTLIENLMDRCWEAKPGNRITFLDIVEAFSNADQSDLTTIKEQKPIKIQQELLRAQQENQELRALLSQHGIPLPSSTKRSTNDKNYFIIKSSPENKHDIQPVYGDDSSKTGEKEPFYI